MRLGANLTSEGTEWLVWAPYAERVMLAIEGEPAVAMQAEPHGYHQLRVPRQLPGARYWYEFNGNRRADPASRFQPDGVHGPSSVVSPLLAGCAPSWRGLPLEEYLLYELHVGCFSETGDFAGVARRLDTLADLGITAIELMPVAQFSGVRNWGYDGVFPFAAQNSYGGPHGLAELVAACHQRGMAVVLDVVYNHLGPEGNYLSEFGPYFTDRYQTPWGRALNFDGRQSDAVRRYVIENACYWIGDLGIDALRLDAVQMIFDNSARPFLGELAERVHALGERLGRRVHLIAETNQNDVRQITPRAEGGWGLDAVWNDDFHHSLHALLTGERFSVFQDFGALEQLATAYGEGFVLQGQYSEHHQRHHGSATREVPGKRFVVFAQNHDQVGNRLYGERLGQLLSDDETRLALAVVLLAPNLPMLFMGEEYGEPAPFLYFVDHLDEHLRKRVRLGRVRDFRDYLQRGRPVPDPTDERTFARSCLDFALKDVGRHKLLWNYTRELIRLRRAAAVGNLTKQEQQVVADSEARWMVCVRGAPDSGQRAVLLFHFGDQEGRVPLERFPEGVWRLALNSDEGRWEGSGGQLPETLVAPAAGASAAALPDIALPPHAATVWLHVEPGEPG